MWKPEPTHIHSYPTLGHYRYPIWISSPGSLPSSSPVFRRNGTTF
ncbi:hypothetical protein JL09_g6744 [Pichia kudriavzevii]|uniref:Uncharacterized protein n=1 Tax=Pichia kudriavzevii TaxID=4909 RepID=A0A099NKL4_PICKU|nr:hypothetical protein JL09_g6744 [Pichia kudriavzevii]